MRFQARFLLAGWPGPRHPACRPAPQAWLCAHEELQLVGYMFGSARPGPGAPPRPSPGSNRGLCIHSQAGTILDEKAQSQSHSGPRHLELVLCKQSLLRAASSPPLILLILHASLTALFKTLPSALSTRTPNPPRGRSGLCIFQRLSSHPPFPRPQRCTSTTSAAPTGPRARQPASQHLPPAASAPPAPCSLAGGELGVKGILPESPGPRETGRPEAETR